MKTKTVPLTKELGINSLLSINLEILEEYSFDHIGHNLYWPHSSLLLDYETKQIIYTNDILLDDLKKLALNKIIISVRTIPVDNITRQEIDDETLSINNDHAKGLLWFMADRLVENAKETRIDDMFFLLGYKMSGGVDHCYDTTEYWSEIEFIGIVDMLDFTVEVPC